MKTKTLSGGCLSGLKIKLFIIVIPLFLTSVGVSEATQFSPLDDIDLLSNSSDLFNSEININDGMSSVDRLRLLLKNGEYDSVIDKIKNLITAEKNNEAIISLKAAALVGRGDFSSAMKEYNLLKSDQNSSDESFATLADMLLQKNKPYIALTVCQTGLMRNVNSAKLLYQMGYSYSLLGKTRTALEYFKGAESANLVSQELKHQDVIERAIAAAYYKLNDFENAKKAFKTKNPDNPDAGLQLVINAKYQVSIGNFEKAFALLDEAQKTSRSVEAALTKAQFYILDSKPDLAIDLLAALENKFSQSNFSDILKITKSLAYLTAKKPQLSLAQLEKVSHPEKIQSIHMLKAITYFSLNEKGRVVEELKQTTLPYSELAVAADFVNYLNEPSLGPTISLAFFCLDQKFYKQAIAIAEQAYSKHSNNILLNFIIAEGYLQNGEYSSAIKELIKISGNFKGSYALQFYLSQAYSKAGMLVEAANTYKSLTEERPDFVLANLVYGKLLSDHSKWSEAKQVYENGLNFMPDSPQLQISLGWTLVHMNDQEAFSDLLPIIEKNTKIEPVTLLHLTGWEAFKNNEVVKAKEQLSKAINLAPGDPEICYHLGMVLMESGNKDVAKNLLQQSLLFKVQREKYHNSIKKVLEENI